MVGFVAFEWLCAVCVHMSESERGCLLSSALLFRDYVFSFATIFSKLAGSPTSWVFLSLPPILLSKAARLGPSHLCGQCLLH